MSNCSVNCPKSEEPDEGVVEAKLSGVGFGIGDRKGVLCSRHTWVAQGLQVSRLGLGTMNFGMVTDEATSFEIMNEALKQGVISFDTADVYGGPQKPDIKRATVFQRLHRRAELGLCLRRCRGQ